MLAIPAKRTDLVGLLVGGQLPSGARYQSNERFDVPGKDDLVLFYQSNEPVPGELPALLQIRRGTVEEFLAWSTSYLNVTFPLTAFTRVIGESELSHFAKLINTPHPGVFATSFAALVIAEAHAHVKETSSRKSVSMPAYLNTLSFYMGRSLSIGLASLSFDRLLHRWAELQHVAQQPERHVDVSVLARVWSVLFSVYGGNGHRNSLFAGDDRSAMVTACREVQQRGEISAATWRELRGQWTELDQALVLMGENRESRVIAVEAIVQRMMELQGKGGPQYSLLAGYLLSRVAPGSLAHLDFALDVELPDRSFVMWYALFAGLHPDAKLGDMVAGWGYRIVRELSFSDHLASPPRADIAFAELEVLARGRSTVSDIPTSQYSVMSVEALPLVNVVMRRPGTANDQSEGSVTSASIADATRLLATLDETLDRARDISLRVSSAIRVDRSRKKKRE